MRGVPRSRTIRLQAGLRHRLRAGALYMVSVAAGHRALAVAVSTAARRRPANRLQADGSERGTPRTPQPSPSLQLSTPILAFGILVPNPLPAPTFLKTRTC